jgi:hypothetical protein
VTFAPTGPRSKLHAKANLDDCFSTLESNARKYFFLEVPFFEKISNFSNIIIFQIYYSKIEYIANDLF